MDKLIDRCKTESDDLRLALTHADYALCAVDAPRPDPQSARAWIRDVRKDLQKAWDQRAISKQTLDSLQYDISDINEMLQLPSPDYNRISDMIGDLQANIDHAIVESIVSCATRRP